MPAFVQTLIDLFMSKKKIIGYGGALAIAGVAIGTHMSAQDVKDAVCGAPVIAIPAPTPSPVLAPAAPATAPK
jgi:hypothetical protein